MVVGFITTYATSAYITNVVSSNPTQTRCIRYYISQREEPFELDVFISNEIFKGQDFERKTIVFHISRFLFVITSLEILYCLKIICKQIDGIPNLSINWIYNGNTDTLYKQTIKKTMHRFSSTQKYHKHMPR
jgi:hypothetical protein